MIDKAVLFEPAKVNQLRALHDHILVCDMQFDSRISHGGIILLSGDKKLEGIHPRWARVYAVGPNQKEVRVGQYVCISHGRWTRGIEITDDDGEKIVRRIDNNDILLISDNPMVDEIIGSGL